MSIEDPGKDDLVGKMRHKRNLYKEGSGEKEEEEETRIDIYSAIIPSSTSAKNFMHWAQSVKSNEFRKFDYGEEENMRKYNQKTPPTYQPSKMQVPVAVFRGGQDSLANPTDVSWLLPQLRVTHDIFVSWYNHFGFIIAVDADKRIYSHILNIITGGPWDTQIVHPW
ncbi:lipase [Plakobranchus ocellatus]|uniref:Lipase n=1 Tax=Plakobranchus ocellatus TaxID=259542 RepID=A0AAV4A7P9_9GAST|nr:lipase [Plakobranchus ocellatus]